MQKTPDMQKASGMQKNLYYTAVISRRNLIGEAILTFFLSICSYPRLVLEVFIRKNMGERYFTMASAITVGTILFLLPWFLPGRSYIGGTNIVTNNPIWYLFVAAYFFFAFLRYREIMRNPSVFDFGKHTKCEGDLLPIFKRTRFNIRQTEIFIEPLTALIPGVFFFMIEQFLPAVVLVFCAVVYSLSKAGAYMLGDHFIMDRIDILLCNEDLREDFLDKGSEQSKHGFTFRHHIPSDPEMRQNLYRSFFEAEDAPVAY